MNESIKLEKLSWVEAEKILNKDTVLLIPLGARTKEHGPHLPLNTDWVMAEYLAKRVSWEVEVVLMPTIQYGYYPSFLEYHGSVSIKLDTFKELIKDICISMNGYGVRKIYILNTGVSTIEGLREVSEELCERGILLGYTDILESGRLVDDKISEQEGGTHADEMETSMMLYIKPSIVDMSKAEKDYNPKKGRGLTRNPIKKGVGAYSPSGIFGDATLATWEKGKEAVEARVSYIIKELQDLKAMK